jgi:general L-amino acid transport system substrate-binding protein
MARWRAHRTFGEDDIMKLLVTRLLASALAIALASGASAATLDEVKKRGELRCGVNSGLPGLSNQGEDGQWRGLDVDFCRAVAAAALGSADRVKFLPLTNRERLEALREGRVDLLSRNTTWTQSRDLGSGLDFVGVVFFDGQGLMVSKARNLRSALELEGVSICTQSATTSEANLREYFAQNRMNYTPVSFDSAEEATKAYAEGRCDVLTSDRSQLYGIRSALSDPDQHNILPEVISKEPLSPAVREGDANWSDLVRWTLFTLINTEEAGISSENADRVRDQASKPEVRRLLDLDGDSGKALGVEPGWGYRIVKQVGNYGEVFDRNLGEQSPLKMKRGLNALWNDGGLLYAPPTR